MDKETQYTIGQVCEILECEHHNLRYIEKVLGLNIERDSRTERLYAEQDLNTLKMVFELKNEGLNYKAIKKVLERHDEVVIDKVEETRNEIILNDGKLQEFMSLLTSSIEKTVDNKVNSMLDTMIKSFEEIKEENKDLRRILEQQQEKHFQELDTKLIKWREEQQARKEQQSFFKRIFKK